MNQLLEVNFFNAAEMNIEKVMLDGNSVLIGTNGAGKTTVLRAVLFFYNANSLKLGIEQSKDNFMNHYFKYRNSYISFLYKNKNGFVILTMYKNVNKINFRFTLTDKKPQNIEDIYFKDNKFLELNEVLNNLREIGECSTVIDSFKDYKNILYGRTENLKMKKSFEYKKYSLFETKEYEGFINAVSNVYLNSNINAEEIKNIIVNSLDLNQKIEIKNIKRKLNEYTIKYNHIKNYLNNKDKINSLILLKNNYFKNKELFQENINNLFYSKKEIENETMFNKSNLEELYENIEKMKELLKQKEKEFNEKKEEFIKKEFSLYSKVKEANQKIKKWKEINIEDILNEDKFEDSLKLELDTNESRINKYNQKELNLKENMEFSALQIKDKYELKEKEYIASINSLKQKENLELKDIEDNKISRIFDLKDEYKNEIELFNEKKSEIKLEEQDIKNQLLILFKKQFQNELYDNLKEKKDILNSHLNKLKILSLEAKKLQDIETSLEMNLNKDLLNLDKFYKLEENKIKTNLNNLRKILYPNENTLAYKIKDSKMKETYISILNEEILNSDIDIELKENSNLIFEIELKENFNYTSLVIKEKSFIDELKQLEENYFKDKENLKNKYQKEIHKTNNELKLKNDEKFNLEKENEKLKKEIFNIQILIEDKKKKFEENLKKEIELLKIAEKENKEKALLLNKDFNHFEKKMKEKELNISNKYLKLKEEKETIFIDKRNKIQYKLEKLRFQKVKELEENISFFKEKSDKFKDSEFNKLIEKNKVIKDKLKKINKNKQNVILYNEDKLNYIDNLTSFKTELSYLREEFNQIESNYNSDIKLNKNELKDLEDKKNNNLVIQNRLGNQLETIIKFEEQFLEVYLNKYNLKIEIEKGLSGDIDLFIKNLHEIQQDLENNFKNLLKGLNKLNEKEVFNNTLNLIYKTDIFENIKNLEEFEANNKINTFAINLNKQIDSIISPLVTEYQNLVSNKGEINKTINKINKLFKDVDIKVIDEIEFRVEDTNNKLLNIFEKLEEEVQTNIGGINSLFNQNDNIDNSKILIEKLIEELEKTEEKEIIINDTFDLKIKIKENGNSTGFSTSLSNIGSKGTSVLVKSMISIGMIHVFHSKFKNQDFNIHLILDEIGELDYTNTKEIIKFANKNKIVFLNGAPNPLNSILNKVYKNFYMLRKNNENLTEINHIINQDL